MSDLNDVMGKYDDSLNIDDIIGRHRSFVLLLIGFSLYTIIYLTVVYLNFGSLGGLITYIGQNFSEWNVYLPVVTGLLSGICSVVVSHTIFQLYVNRNENLNLSVSGIIYKFFAILIGGFFIFIPTLFVVGLPLSILLSLDRSVTIAFAVASFIPFMIVALGIINRAQLGLNEHTLSFITDCLDENDEIEKHLYNAEKNVDSEYPEESLDSLIHAKDLLTSSEAARLDEFRAVKIINKRNTLEESYEDTSAKLHSIVVSSARSHYNNEEYLKSYNMLVLAESIKNNLDVVNSGVDPQGEISINNVEFRLESRADSLEKEIRQYINESEKLAENSQYNESIVKLEKAEEAANKWREIVNVAEIHYNSDFNPDKIDDLKIKTSHLKNLAINIKSIDWGGGAVSHQDTSSTDNPLFEPITEIARMSDAGKHTNIAIYEALPVCDRLANENEFEMARTGYQTALEAAKAVQDSEMREILKTKIESLRIKEATKRFLDQEDYIRDSILSGEARINEEDYNEALSQFRDANQNLPSEVANGADCTRQAFQQRIDDGLTTARQQLLSTTLEPDDTVPDDHLEQIYTEIGISSIQNNKNMIPTGSAFDNLIEEISEIVSQIEFKHSLQSRIESAQTDYRGHIEATDHLLTKKMEVRNKKEIPASEDDGEVHLAIATKAKSAISSATKDIEAYTESIETIERAYNSTSSDPVRRCLQAIEERLLNIPTESISVEYLAEVEKLTRKIATYDIVVIQFSALPVSQVVEDISNTIETEGKIAITAFDREFDRIERIISPELDSIYTEIESFIDTWGDHPSVDSLQWSQTVKQARNSGEFEDALKLYQKIQEISDNTWTLADLHKPSWEKFEYLVASLYTLKGYKTQVTKGSKDLGVDIWAHNGQRLAIQVKQFTAGNTVGRTVIQQLESTLARGKADRVVVVTSSSFANTAVEYAKNSESVELIDGEELVRQLIKYDVRSVSDKSTK